VLSPYHQIYWNLLNFSTNPAKIPKKTLGSVGGDTLWAKILEKLNYYVRENPGEMSAL